jgi:GMP synthase-like glutamine amidotransferase
MSLKIHCFQQAPFEGMGCIKEWCEKNGHTISYTRFYDTPEIPSINDYDWLIVMGGPMGVNDEDKLPWLTGEKNAIREAISQNKTVVGICLGSQLIASALGADVRNNHETEIGWFDVTLTETGKAEPLMDDFPHTFKVFQWHGDTFDIPEGAKHLASSGVCKNQAFLYKNNVLGLQFHFEVTNDSLAQMLDGADDELTDAPFIQSKDDIQKNAFYIGSTNEKMFLILDRLKKGEL